MRGEFLIYSNSLCTFIDDVCAVSWCQIQSFLCLLDLFKYNFILFFFCQILTLIDSFIFRADKSMERESFLSFSPAFIAATIALLTSSILLILYSS